MTYLFTVIRYHFRHTVNQIIAISGDSNADSLHFVDVCHCHDID